MGIDSAEGLGCTSLNVATKQSRSAFICAGVRVAGCSAELAMGCGDSVGNGDKVASAAAVPAAPVLIKRTILRLCIYICDESAQRLFPLQRFTHPHMPA